MLFFNTFLQILKNYPVVRENLLNIARNQDKIKFEEFNILMQAKEKYNKILGLGMQADKYTDFDVLRRRLEEDKAEAPDLLSEILAESREASIHYDKKFMSFYAQPTEELSENDNWLIKLYRDTLFTIATRYSELILEPTSAFARKSLFGQAIFYNMMGAKAKCPDSYENLCTLINGKTPQYESFFRFLIPFLEEKDVHAQELFNMVFCDMEDIVEQYIKDFHHLPIVHYKEEMRKYDILVKAKENYKNNEGLILWNRAQDLWDKDPEKALNHLSKAEPLNDDASEKLKTLRQSDAYKKTTKLQENDPAHLLKNIDSKNATKYYEHYLEFIKNNPKNNKIALYSKELVKAITCLYKAVTLGNIGAVKASKDLKKSKGYKAAQNKKSTSSEDLSFNMGFQYYLTESVHNLGYRPLMNQEKEVRKSTNNNNSPVNSPPVPSPKAENVSAQQEKAQSVPNTNASLQKIEVDDGAIFVLPGAGGYFVPESWGKKQPNKTAKKEEQVITPPQDNKKTPVKAPVEKQQSTRKTLKRTVSVKAQKPEERAEKPHKEIISKPNTNNTPVIEMPQKIEEAKPKADIPNQDHVASSSREESHEFAPMPARRQLQRADSVRELSTKERQTPPLKRTASLGQMPKVAEPTPETHKKSKTLSFKKGVEFLLPKKKLTPTVEKSDSASSH